MSAVNTAVLPAGFDHHHLVMRGVAAASGDTRTPGMISAPSSTSVSTPASCSGTKFSWQVAGAIALVRMRRVLPLRAMGDVARPRKSRHAGGHLVPRA